MNKFTKASIAGAAGIALLLGGAGTLAYWNDSANLSQAGSVTAGTLAITAGVDGVWDKDIALIVPGDVLTYTQELTLSATGDNLKFTVSSNIADLVTAGSIAGVTVTPTFVVTDASNTTITPVGGVYTPASGATKVKATVVVSFDSGTANKVGQGQSLNLGTAAVTVTQVAP